MEVLGRSFAPYKRTDMKTLFGSSLYSPNGPQYGKPKLVYKACAGLKASIETVSKLSFS